MALKHAKTSALTDSGSASLVQPSDWNADHVADNGEFAQTGDFKLAMRASAPTGWIIGDGSTIGNVGSGATRANADTLALFTLWWTDFSNAQLPILTSAGAGSTRGASAAADWAANKRLTVFDARGRFARVSDATVTPGAFQAATAIYREMINDNIVRSPNNTGNVLNSDGDYLNNVTVAYATGTNGSVASNYFSKMRPDALTMLGLFKL